MLAMRRARLQATHVPNLMHTLRIHILNYIFLQRCCIKLAITLDGIRLVDVWINCSKLLESTEISILDSENSCYLQLCMSVKWHARHRST